MSPQNKKIEFLTKHELFGLLPDDVILNMSYTLPTTKFKKGQFIFHHDDEARYAYLIISGQGELEVSSRNGKVLSFARVRPGTFFGEFSVLDHGTRSASAVAITDMKVICFSRALILDLVHKFPEFSMQLILHLVKMVRKVDRQLQSIHFLNLSQKIAFHLDHELSKSPNSNMDIILTQKQIATSVMASREKVNSALRLLKDEGIIHTARSQVRVIDVARLKKFYQESI